MQPVPVVRPCPQGLLLGCSTFADSSSSLIRWVSFRFSSPRFAIVVVFESTVRFSPSQVAFRSPSSFVTVVATARCSTSTADFSTSSAPSFLTRSVEAVTSPSSSSIIEDCIIACFCTVAMSAPIAIAPTCADSSSVLAFARPLRIASSRICSAARANRSPRISASPRVILEPSEVSCECRLASDAVRCVTSAFSVATSESFCAIASLAASRAISCSFNRFSILVSATRLSSSSSFRLPSASRILASHVSS